jgi:hypothetical protein
LLAFLWGLWSGDQLATGLMEFSLAQVSASLLVFELGLELACALACVWAQMTAHLWSAGVLWAHRSVAE